jgi:rod shape-determining protein MreC
LLLSVEAFPGARRVSSSLVRLGLPIERGFYIMVSAARRPFSWLILGQDAADKIATLEISVATLGADRARLQQLEEENKQLRSITGLSAQTIGTPVAARVIGFDPRSVQDLMRIAGGHREGITEGSAVVTPEGNLVGVVIEVGDASSVFRLLRSREMHLPARIPSSDNAFGVLESPESLSLNMRQIPKEAHINEGDVVVTNTGFPGLAPGIPIGSITAVSAPPEQLWQEVTIEPFATVGSLDIVTVVVVNYGS